MHLSNPVISLEQRAKASGLSVNELCRRAGVARSTFTRWKNGKSSPTFSILKKFEEIFSSIPNTTHPPGNGKGKKNKEVA